MASPLVGASLNIGGCKVGSGKTVNLRDAQSPNLKAILSSLADTMSHSGISKDKEETIKKLIKTVVKEKTGFLQNHILLSAVKDFSLNSSLQTPFTEKVAQILALEEVLAYSSCNCDQEIPTERHNLLGLKRENTETLSGAEMINFRTVVSDKLVEKCVQIQTHFYNTDSENTGWLPVSSYEHTINRIKEGLDESIQFYNSAVTAYLSEVKALLDIFAKKSTIIHDEMDRIKKTSELLQLRARILECKYSLALYTEEPMMLDALGVLLNLLKDETEKFKVELHRLQNTIEAYNKLECTEYDSIVQKYAETLEALKQKKWTLKKLQQE